MRSRLPFLFLAACSAARSSASSSETLTVDGEIARRSPDFYQTEQRFERDGVAVVRTPSGGIFLRAKTCELRDAVLAGLAGVRALTEPGFVLGDVPKNMLASGWCEAKIDLVLTPYLAQTLAKVIDDNAAQSNCWGHSAAVVGIVSGVQELRATAFTSMLRSPLCRILRDDEAPRSGDVVALRSVTENAGVFEFEEVHTAVVVTPDLWSQKLGSAAFSIASERAILDSYFESGSPPECRRRSPNAPSAEELRRCQTLIDVYRCESVAHYRERTPGSYAIYDAVSHEVAPWRWETVHQQQAAEVADDPVVPKGHAYVSRFPFDPVRASYGFDGDEVPREVAARLDEMANDPYLKTTYDLGLPVIPALPFPYEFGAVVEAYKVAEQLVLDALRGSVSPEERPLIELLLVEMASSQHSEIGFQPPEDPPIRHLFRPAQKVTPQR